MNALRAPLTVFPDLTATCANFSFDKADDFIDGLCLSKPQMVEATLIPRPGAEKFDVFDELT